MLVQVGKATERTLPDDLPTVPGAIRSHSQRCFGLRANDSRIETFATCD